MFVYDPLYGRFELPSFLEDLVLAPEFRRLSGVRLLNIGSVSLAALGETTRYSHTLGVLRLALLNPFMGLGEDEVKAFLASIIVHDAGTPAFAHLFEYALFERYRWDHESAAYKMLVGEEHPDGHLHQLWGGQSGKFEKLCQRSGIDFELVLDIVALRHPYSKLLFGTMDFDNLDNVARMNWMLGQNQRLTSIYHLAENLTVNASGALCLARTADSHVRSWLQMRAEAYRVLLFDGPTVAGQAVLSRAIADALEAGHLNLSDAGYDDVRLINALRQSPSIKKRLDADFFGRLPDLSLIHVAHEGLERLDALGRQRLTALIEEFLRAQFGRVAAVYGYAFRDRGTLSKRVDFVDPHDGALWYAGERSEGFVLYGFVRGNKGGPAMAERVGTSFAEWVGGKL